MDEADLQTETFTNSQGWIAIRVTHAPTSLFVERSRSESLQSPVIAQKECIDELKSLLPSAGWQAIGTPAAAGGDGGGPVEDDAAAQGSVSRAEFSALVARVARLEGEIGFPDTDE